MNRASGSATAAVLFGLVLLGSCVGGDSPVGPVTRTASVAVVPRFAVEPAAEAPAINRIRLTAYAPGTPPTVLATAEIDVDPTASEWDVSLEVPVGSGSDNVYILVELLHVSGNVATVEYSGTTPSFSLSSGSSSTVQQVEVVRGPSDNLNVTSVTVSPDTATLVEGDSVALQATVTMSGGSASPVVYWSSLDAEATVSATGMVRGLLPGTARVMARSGAFADTARIVVLAIPRAVRVSPDTARADALGATLTFTGTVLDARDAPIPGQDLLWRSLNPDRLTSMGGGVFQTVGAGVSTVEALLAADTTVRGQAVVVTALALVDLAVTKEADRASAVVGDTIAYSVTVRNEGGQAVDGVAVLESLPGNVVLVDATADVGSYDAQADLWTVGSLALGAEAHLTVRARTTSSGEAENTATLAGDATEADGIAENNEGTASVTVGERLADLSVTKSADRSTALDGDTVNYTVTVTNAGPYPADSVVVGDELPPMLTLRSSSATQGTYASGEWNVGALAVGASATLTVRTRIQDGVSDVVVENVAEVVRLSGALDPDLDNQSATASVSVGRRIADLSVDKVVDTPSAQEGDTVVFTVTVSNAGPDEMTDIVLVDSLPEPTHVVHYGMTQGSADTVNSIWYVGALDPGQTATLTLDTQFDEGSGGHVWTNVVHITSYYGADDLDTDDHRAEATVTVGSSLADLAVTGSATPPSTSEDTDVVFDVVLTNLGPGTATDILAQGVVGDGLQILSSSVTRGTLDGKTGTWSLDTLKAGASETFQLTTHVSPGVAGATVQGKATILQSTPADPNATNDTIVVSVPVTGPDLSVTKTVDLATPNITENVTFTVAVQNLSATEATGVTVTDSVPAELVFVSASVPGYDSGTGVWDVGVLPGSGTAQLMVTATPTAGSRGTAVVNTATLTAATPVDSNPVNDTASATVTPVNQAPTVDAQSVTTPETTPITIHLSAADLDGDSLVFTKVSDPKEGTLSAFTDLKRTGASITYTPTAGKWGTFPFTVRVSDGFDTADAVITVTVTEVAKVRSFTTPGNTEFLAGPSVTEPGSPHVYETDGLLPAGTTLQVTDVGCTPAGLSCSDALGERTVTADGSLRFRPAVGATNVSQTYTYQTDSGGSAQFTLTISADRVWYVKSGYSGDGRSWDPFGSLALAESPGPGVAPAISIGGPSGVMMTVTGASGPGDVIYVAAGTYAETIDLDSQQTLTGEASDLIVGGTKLAGAGTRPTVKGPIVLAAGATVAGLAVDGSAGDGIAGTSTGISLKNLTVQNVGNDGIALSGGTGGAILDAVTVSGAPGRGLTLLGVTGSVTASTMSVSADVAGALAAVEVLQGNPTFSYNGSASASSGAFSLFNVDSTTAGADISFLGGPYTAVADTAARMFAASGSVRVDGLVINTGTGIGVSIVSSPGSFDFNDLDIDSVTYNAINISGGAPVVDFTFANSSLDHTSNSTAVYIEGTGGADISFDGGPIEVVSSGRGIWLYDNAGSTVTFYNRLNLSTTGSDPAIEATAGGTLVIRDATDNVIGTTTGKAVYLDGVDIGADGVTLRSVSTDGAPNGVYIHDAGTGPFTITGSGSAGSGGTIANSTSEGIYVASPTPLTLDHLNITGSDGDGLYADGISGLAVDDGNFSSNWLGCDGDCGAGIALTNVTGSMVVSNSLMDQNGHAGISLSQDKGTATLDISNTTLSGTVDASGGGGLDVDVNSDGNVDVSLTGSTIKDNGNLGLDVSTYLDGILSIEVGGAGALANTFSGNAQGGVRLDMSSGSTTDLTFDINNNTFDGPLGNAVTVETSSGMTGNLEGFVRDNTLTNSMNALGSRDAIFINVPDGVGIISLSGNTLGSAGAPLVASEYGIGVLVASAQLDLTVENNAIFTAAPSGDAPGVYINQSDTGPVCLNLDGNDVTGTWSTAYPFQLYSSASSAFKLQGFTGSTAPEAATFLAPLNTVNGGAATTGHFDMSGTFAGGTCSTPSISP